MFFAQHLPDRFLPIHCQAVTGPMIHRHFIAPLQYKVSHGCALMIRRTSNHEHQVTIRRRTRTGPESAKGLLRQIIQRHPIVTAAQGRDCRDRLSRLCKARTSGTGVFSQHVPRYTQWCFVWPRSLQRQSRWGQTAAVCGVQSAACPQFQERYCAAAKAARQHPLWFLDTEAACA